MAVYAIHFNQAKRASYGGGDYGGGGGASGGTLSRYDFSRALEELGVHVDGWEAGALMDRFGVEMDEVNQAKMMNKDSNTNQAVSIFVQ